MNAIGLTGLVKIELPDQTVRLCDGAFFNYQDELYQSEDDTFGTIGSLRAMSIGVGNIVPALVLTLLPPDGTAVGQISRPGNQTSRVTFSIAEYDANSGLISSGAVFFDGQLDQTILDVGEGGRTLTISVVSLAERLFERNIGNSMNSTWHKSVWPGELGQDNATGLAQPVAWGTESQGGVRSGSGVTFGGTFISREQMVRQ